ncbi:MAG: asparagine synthase (glutamine-hydrolyzing) [Sphingobacteriaceae bacterium]|nr:asparagine synthase (glutamine-hydrolyzing) [Sphingobacteriaceae bacterium]
MCGIAGILKYDNEIVNESEIRILTDLMHHRGPDGEGVYCDGAIGLGHRRLAIIDLSDDGKQPMLYGDRYVITYNGEIYNYLEIRKELEDKGYVFKSQTDTEVILAAYDNYGEDCVNLFNGMWSFVIYDKMKQRLFCCRDRFGVKPFYYSIVNGKFIFSSEIKPILTQHLTVKVNKRILMEYLVLNMSDHTNDTFFEGVNTLAGGHKLIFDLQTKTFNIHKYYTIARNEKLNQLSEQQTLKLFLSEFERSVTWRLRSDVKIGACLSGGLDSSFISAVASRLHNMESGEKFNAITAESLDPAVNEKEFARLVVDKLNLEWHVTSPTTLDFLNDVKNLVRIQEEPFGTPSVYLQYAVMKKAKQNGVTVLLDGQGADEILLGYPRYIGAFLKSLSFWRRFFVLRNITRNYGISLKSILLNYFYFTNVNIRKLRVLSRLGRINKDYLESIDFITVSALSKAYGNLNELQNMEITQTQIPQLLKWEDKNSMACSIETRLPFMDYSVVETSLSINNKYKLNNLWSKYILRKAMEGMLPAEIVFRRKKIGFTAPTKEWLHNTILWNDVMVSPLLNSIFENNISKPKDVNLMWRMCNIALWEKEFNVKG